jgi:hypothetical protein
MSRKSNDLTVNELLNITSNYKALIYSLENNELIILPKKGYNIFEENDKVAINLIFPQSLSKVYNALYLAANENSSQTISSTIHKKL